MFKMKMLQQNFCFSPIFISVFFKFYFDYSFFFFPFQWYYYFAIVEDFVLRFAWTITVSVGEGGILHGEIVKSVLGPLEVFR